MDFGDILNDWEKETAKPYGKKRLKNDRDRELAAPAPDESDGNAPKRPSGSSGERSLPRANPMDVWLRRYGIQDKDSVLESESESVTPAEKRRQLHAMRSEAVLDLHGLTRDEAWSRLESFFADCVRRGLKKVLVIHGKGTHSEDDPVLAPLVKLFIEQNRHAGESGHSCKEEGGSGSTWIILK